jgi:hypothetical protein
MIHLAVLVLDSDNKIRTVHKILESGLMHIVFLWISSLLMMMGNNEVYSLGSVSGMEKHQFCVKKIFCIGTKLCPNLISTKIFKHQYLNEFNDLYYDYVLLQKGSL